MKNFHSFVVLMLVYIVGANCQDCSGRPSMQLHNDCCKVNLAPQQEECLTRIHEQWDAFRQSPNKDSVKMSNMCASDCIVNNTNVITPDNKVNADEVKIELEKMLGTEWQSVLPNMIATCKDRIDNGPQGPGNGPQGPGNGPLQGPNSPMANCNMTKEKLFFCFTEQFLANCPDSLWKNTEDCNGMRSFLKKCPFERRNGHGGPRGGQP